MHVAIIQIYGTLIFFQLKDNGKLPNYILYPSVHPEEKEDERVYDLIGFSGREVMKDTIKTHGADSNCKIYFDSNKSDYVLQVNYNNNFCGTRTCSELAPVSGCNKKV